MSGEPETIAVGSEPPPMARPPSSNGQGKRGNRQKTKSGDRFAVLNTFVDFSLVGLSRNELAAWLVLYRDTRNETARTSQADIARRIGTSDRTVRRAIDGLKRRGLLDVAYRGGIGRGVSTYKIRGLPPNG